MKSKYILGIVFIAIVAVLIGISAWSTSSSPNTSVSQPPISSTSTPSQACTQEAKQCPDGSYVGRTGPECSFAACPTATTQGSGILQGTMTIGPICPVEQVGHPCNPTPAMYSAHQVYVYNSDKSKLITTLTPDAQGKFSATLPTGTYVVDVKHQAVGALRGVPTTVVIVSGKIAMVSIDIDTGIR